jgi:hypothetical protein
MWDALLKQDAPELAQALHVGKQSLIYEFSGLSAPDGTVIDAFYHHVYGVIGDPSIPVRLLEPKDINVDIAANSDLIASYVSINLTDEEDNMMPGVVGALLNENNELIAKSVSNSQGQLIIDFDTNATSDLMLYLNSAQYKQKVIPLNYLSDDGSTYSGLIPVDISVSQVFDTEGVSSSYLIEGLNDLELRITNNSSDILNIQMEVSSNNNDISISQNSQIHTVLPYDDVIMPYAVSV